MNGFDGKGGWGGGKIHRQVEKEGKGYEKFREAIRAKEPSGLNMNYHLKKKSQKGEGRSTHLLESMTGKKRTFVATGG